MFLPHVQVELDDLELELQMEDEELAGEAAQSQDSLSLVYERAGDTSSALQDLCDGLSEVLPPTPQQLPPPAPAVALSSATPPEHARETASTELLSRHEESAFSDIGDGTSRVFGEERAVLRQQERALARTKAGQADDIARQVRVMPQPTCEDLQRRSIDQPPSRKSGHAACSPLAILLAFCAPLNPE